MAPRPSDTVTPISRRELLAGAASSAALMLVNQRAFGADEGEIKIGNIDAYSGPAGVYAVLGRLPGAYFRMINDQGGINGRKINYISYDDAYSPPKTVEQARRLVESDEVAAIFSALGAPTNSAIMKYMNIKKVPEIFIASGGSKFGDPANFPWTMGFQPRYQGEGRAFAHNVLTSSPNAKVGILYQNDDFGRDVLKGFIDGLGGHASMIVAKIPYESTDPTIDSQMVTIRAAGADVFMSMTTPKFAAQAIRKIAELGWKPTHYLGSNASSTAAVLKPAGFENSKGIISSAYMKDANDEAWKDDPAFKTWNAFLDKYYPEGDRKRFADRLRLPHQPDHGSGAQAVRRGFLPRQHHEAGRQPEGLRSRSAAARHQDQHQPDGLLSDRAAPAHPVQRRTLRAVRPGDRLLAGRLILVSNMTPLPTTAAQRFDWSVEKWGERPFLCVGPLATRSYLPQGWEISYREAAGGGSRPARIYAAAGYGFGHRIGLLFENRPDHHLHFLALNGLGVSIVPLNPDYRPDESRYVIEHSELCLIVALPERAAIAEVAAGCAGKPPVVLPGDGPFAVPAAPSAPPRDGKPDRRSEASLLYTSGTTGRPKGCVIPNQYYDNIGWFYGQNGGAAEVREGVERIFNPLPLFHMNAGVTSFMGAIHNGGCSILPDRFHPASWWREIIDSRATIAHYLGIIPAILMKAPPSPDDRAHGLHHCVGAGVEPRLARRLRATVRRAAGRTLGHDRKPAAASAPPSSRGWWIRARSAGHAGGPGATSKPGWSIATTATCRSAGRGNCWCAATAPPIPAKAFSSNI